MMQLGTPVSRRAGWESRFGRLRSNGLTLLSLLPVILLFVYPFVMLVASAFRTGAPGREGAWTVQPFINAYTDPRTWETLRNSLLYAASKQILVLVVAVLFAIVATRTDHPLGKLITPVAIFIFAMPSLFFAISWGMLGNPRIGTINVWLQSVFGDGAPVLNIESWWGLVAVTALKSIAVEYLILLGPFRAMDRSLEEASLVAGASTWKTIIRVNLPVLAPALGAVAIIGFANVMGTLEAPMVLGLPAGIYVFASRIYGYINAEYPAQYGEASALSLMLVALVLVLVALQNWFLSRRSFVTVSGKSYRRERWHIGRPWSWLIGIAIVGYTVLALILPLFQLVTGSFQAFFGQNQGFTTQNYRALFELPTIWGIIINTIVIAVVGGFVAMTIAMGFAYARVRRTKAGAAISILTWVTYALPGLLLGMAMLWAFVPVPGLRTLYGTIWIVLIGLIVNTVPLSNRLGEASLEQLSPQLEEAARVSGASRLRAIRQVLVPLIAPSFFVGWLIALVMIIGNLDVPVLMAGPENETIAVRVFRFYTAGQITRAAALFCVLLVITAVLIGFGLIAMKLWRRSRAGREDESGVPRMSVADMMAREF